jgi:plastocyanin
VTRLARLTLIYALFAAAVVAAPLSASEEPVPVEDPAAAVEPEAPTPAEPGDPAEPAPAPTPAPAAPEPAPAPAPAEPPAQQAPAAPAAPEPQPVRDDEPVERPRATAAASTTVTITDFEFTPAAITVDVGDTVTWANEGPTPHSATASDGSFDTGIYGEGESRSHTFDQAGTFAYICTPHPFMKGTVTVQAASTGGGGDDAGAGAGGDTSGDESLGVTGAADSDGPTLPATGLDAATLLLLGLGALVLGVWLRRGAAAPRPAGRSGW